MCTKGHLILDARRGSRIDVFARAVGNTLGAYREAVAAPFNLSNNAIENCAGILLKKLAKYMQANWERVLFGIVGAACLVFCFRFLVTGNIAAGSALFGMSFFSFFYSNLARFKKFKGLGFEAELWEDKQKEAADLISRFKGLVTLYTREIVMGNVMRGRWGGGDDQWTGRWKLFDDLTGKHSELGQEIDFSALRNDVESVFIFDICSPLASSVRKAIEQAKSQVSTQLQQKYGLQVSNINSWNAELAKLREIEPNSGELFHLARNQNIAQLVLNTAANAANKLTAYFSVTVNFEPETMNRLRALAEMLEQRPITVTPQLIEWADHD